MIASTSAFLVAGRFGVAPTVNRNATAGLKLVQTSTPPLGSNDPDGVLSLFSVTLLCCTYESSPFHDQTALGAAWSHVCQ